MPSGFYKERQLIAAYARGIALGYLLQYYVKYFTGGLNADILRMKDTIINTVEIWNDQRDEWKEGELLPETRAGATFAAINGKPHLIGGRGYFLVRI